MSTMRKTIKLLKHPKQFFVDAISNRQNAAQPKPKATANAARPDTKAQKQGNAKAVKGGKVIRHETPRVGSTFDPIKLLLHPKQFIVDAFSTSLKATKRGPAQTPGNISLLVVVGREHTDLRPWLRNVFGPAGGSGAKVSAVFLLPEDHPELKQLIEQVDSSKKSVEYMTWSDQEDFPNQYHEALGLTRGHWIGHSTPDSTYSPGHFGSLSKIIRQKQFSACAFACDIQVSGKVSTRLNQHLKTPLSLTVGSEKQRPFYDLHNLYLSKQHIGVRGIAPTHPNRVGCIEMVHAYFEDLDGSAVHFTNACKTMPASALSTEFGLFGFVEVDALNAMAGDAAELVRLFPVEETMPDWMRLRIAMACCYLYGQEVSSKQSGAADEQTLLQLRSDLQTLVARVDFNLLTGNRIDAVSWSIRYGVIARHLAAWPLQTPVHADAYDSTSCLLKVKWPTPANTRPVFLRNGKEIEPVLEKVITYMAAGIPLYYEHLVWLPTALMKDLAISVNGQSSPIYLKGVRHNQLAIGQLKALQPSVNFNDIKSPGVYALRRAAQSAWARKRFANAWLFLDKDDKADDNAEHFYRAIKDHPVHGPKSFFVLRQESRDWARLEAEGFQLLPFGSVVHKLALLNSAWLFSSHAAPFVVNLLPKKHYGDMLTHKFCFLQHGVTKDDQSAWLNSRQIDLLVTAGRPEYESMVGGRYKYTAREVALTGFPRHDALLAKKSAEPKTIIFMPTWRLHLAGKLIGKTSQRELNPMFASSDFCQQWNQVLSDAEFIDRLTKAGYRVVFIPHPNIKPYLHHFQLPPNMVVADLDSISIQDYLADCALLLTDYSSITFDVAYLRRPVMYFQFDRADFFSGHTYAQGYYDYQLDGFGPLLEEATALKNEIVRHCGAQFQLEDIYRQRIDRFFAYDDDQNSTRLLKAVVERCGPYRMPRGANRPRTGSSVPARPAQVRDMDPVQDLTQV
jgi:CDP-glycerol glycerophosphotransferase (TagB/SpsB family)